MRRVFLLMAFVAVALLLAGGVAMVATLAVPEEARAAFPGKNGKITFMSDRDGDNDIYTVSFTGENLKRLTNNTRKDDREPAWSADGRKIVFSSGLKRGDLRLDIFVMKADGSDKTRITDERKIPGTAKANDRFPSFSPSGRRIVFIRDSLASSPDLYKMNADGTNLTRLTKVGAEDRTYSPSWSPEGSRIAYSHSDYYDQFVETIRPDGSGERFLTYGGSPDWSPNGSQIVVSKYGEIYKMNADGTDEKRLTTSEAYDSDPAFSPGGGKIVFASNPDISSRDSDSDLYIMDADGTNVRQLTNLPGDEGSPDWRPVQ